MGLSVRNVTIMSGDPSRLADFWAAAMGFDQQRDSADEILLAPPDWSYPRFTVQRTETTRAHPGPVHLDLNADDMEAEVRRLVSLGATERWRVEGAQAGGVTWTVMTDPDGNEFCVVQRASAD